MFKPIAIVILILSLGSCDSANSDQSAQSDSSATAEQSSAVKQQSQIKVSFNGTTYDFVVYGRCAGGPHYNFWGIKPEFVNTTGQGPRIHLIGGPKETVIKFYRNDQQQLNKILTGADVVPYQNGKMHITIDGKDAIDIRVDCRQ
jgi:hypothetical protein